MSRYVKTKRKLREIPFTNNVGQKVNPGDKVVFVSKNFSVIGIYKGLVGVGTRVAYVSHEPVSRHKVTNEKFSFAAVRKMLGEKAIKHSEVGWREYYKLLGEQNKRIWAYRDEHYITKDEDVTRHKWSARKAVYLTV